VQNSALPRGNSGVTLWKIRRYPKALAVAKLLAYVLYCLKVIDEFPATNLEKKGILLGKTAIGIRTQLSAKAKTGKPDGSQPVFVRRTAQKRVITK
jgi:hypothetical protein